MQLQSASSGSKTNLDFFLFDFSFSCQSFIDISWFDDSVSIEIPIEIILTFNIFFIRLNFYFRVNFRLFSCFLGGENRIQRPQKPQKISLIQLRSTKTRFSYVQVATEMNQNFFEVKFEFSVPENPQKPFFDRHFDVLVQVDTEMPCFFSIG